MGNFPQVVVDFDVNNIDTDANVNKEMKK